jgi:phosphoesterase RecJ-like protein
MSHRRLLVEMSNEFFHEAEARLFKRVLEDLGGKRVAVLGHLRPDGDCIGSQVALCRVLRDAGADAVCVNSHPIPANLRFLAEGTPFHCGTDFDADGREAVFVDCAGLDRVGDALAGKFASAAVNIDHHVSNTRFARVNIVLPESAAACAMLAAFLADTRTPFDARTAQALYTGMVTDTGQFRYSSTTPEVHELAARLIRAGASVSATTSALHEQNRPAMLALLQEFLATLQFRDNGRVCAGEITAAALGKTGATREDAEGFVDYPRCLAGVDIAVLLEETAAGVKGSLRAKNPIYRVDLLGRALDGGGHILAAGFHLRGATLAEGRRRVFETITRHLASVDAGDTLGG